MDHFDATAVSGDCNHADPGHCGKGLAYDWQTLYVATETADLDRELAAFRTIRPADAA